MGLGLGEWMPQVPPHVSSEASRLGLHLGIVPDEVPFQEVLRAFWALSARSTTSNLMDSLGTQTALARAANRPDAGQAVIRQLAQAMDGWAAFLDIDEPGTVIWPAQRAELLPGLRQECARFQRADMPSAATFELDGRPVVVYPILADSRLVGSLAVGAGRHVTKADRQVMMTVATLLSIRARQRHAESATVRALEAMVAKLLVSGEAHAARLVAQELELDGMLEQPVRILAVDHRDGEPDLVLREVRDRVALHGGHGLVHRGERILYAILPREASVRSAVPHGRPGGWRGLLSEPLHLAEIAGHLPMLRTALAQMADGQLAVEGDGGWQRATGWVRTLRGYERSDLFSAVRAYLAARGTWEEAARVLGIHRNSLRLRIATAGTLLQVDLDDPDVAAELWLAIRDAER